MKLLLNRKSVSLAAGESALLFPAFVSSHLTKLLQKEQGSKTSLPKLALSFLQKSVSKFFIGIKLAFASIKAAAKV